MLDCILLDYCFPKISDIKNDTICQSIFKSFTFENSNLEPKIKEIKTVDGKLFHLLSDGQIIQVIQYKEID
jgi:hypothetical protein